MAFRGQRSLTSSLASSPLLTFLVLPFLIFLVSFPAPASAIGSAVVGIDVGTEYLKAALVKPGIPLEIVLTKDSKRKQPAAVAFKPSRESDASFPERFYGADALALAARYPDDVYGSLKTLLGIPFNGGENEVVRTYHERYPALKLEGAPGDRGTVGLRSDRLGQTERKDAFLVEEILAMQLKEIKDNAEVMAGKGSEIRDAVITCPSFYSAEEKRSLELAAELAGLNVNALISDGLAVGLNYATGRTFPSVSQGEKPEYNVVYDMGAGSTTASVLRFQNREVKDVGRYNKTIHEVQVLGTGWDRTLGGHALNELILNDMIETFAEDKKLNKETLKAHGKTVAKLWNAAEKARQILSANTETSTSIEGLFEEDLTFRYKISRSKFESLAENHAARVAKPLEQALAASGLQLGDIDSVILHGGLIRTPFVQKELEKAIGNPGKIRANVNADEAAVFGASFKGAALSRSFRVKDIRTSDVAAYPVVLKWTSDDKQRSQKLFTPTSFIGPEKEVTLKNLDDFKLDFFQQIPTTDGVHDSPVLSVDTKNLTASIAKLKDSYGCTTANATSKFLVHLRPSDGLPEVVGGWASCEVESAEKKGSVVDDVKGFFGLGSKKDGQAPLGENDAKADKSTAQEAEEPRSTSSSTSSTGSTTSSTPGTPETADTAKESKNVVVQTKSETIPISLSSSPLGIPIPSPPEMNRIRSRLAAFDASDHGRIMREEALNELESYIYRSRDLVEDEEFVKALKADQLTSLKEKVAATSDWLYGDGAEAKTADFQERLGSLKDIVIPALTRKEENLYRPTRVQLLRDMLNNARTVTQVMQKQIEDDEGAYSSSLSASASSSSSESESSSTATSASTTTPSSSNTASSEDLDEDPYTTSSSKTTSTPRPSAKPTGPRYSTFQPSDLTTLSQFYESTNTWFTNQYAIQEKLTDSDDPALPVYEMDTRMRQLEKILSRMYERLGASSKRPGAGGERPKKGGNNDKDKSEKSKTESSRQRKEKAPPRDEL